MPPPRIRLNDSLWIRCHEDLNFYALKILQEALKRRGAEILWYHQPPQSDEIGALRLGQELRGAVVVRRASGLPVGFGGEERAVGLGGARAVLVAADASRAVRFRDGFAAVFVRNLVVPLEVPARAGLDGVDHHAEELGAGPTPVANPAFDVTPAALIDGIVSERGVAAASREGLAKLFPERAARQTV